MRKLLIMAAYLSAASAFASNDIKLSTEQLNNLGINLGKAVITQSIPLLTAPAKVTIPSAQDYMVSSNQAGLITTLSAAVGDSIKKGAVLAKINSPSLLALQAQYLKAANDLRLANSNYQRDKKLFNEGVIAQRREQETLNSYSSAVFAENEAKQLLAIAGMSESAIATLASSHRFSSDLEIRAPISGVVIERLATVGARVDTATPLYRVADLHNLWLDINVPQEHSNTLKIGDEVVVEHSAIRGKISLLGQSINPENQTLLARAVVSSPQQGSEVLRAGANCTVQINRASHQAAFTVPNTAIAQNEGKAFVFMRTREGFNIKAVEIIGKQANESIISGDLNEQAELAVNGVVALKAMWLESGSGAE